MKKMSLTTFVFVIVDVKKSRCWRFLFHRRCYFHWKQRRPGYVRETGAAPVPVALQVIQVHAVDRSGRAQVRKPVRLAQMLSIFRELSSCEVELADWVGSINPACGNLERSAGLVRPIQPAGP